MHFEFLLSTRSHSPLQAEKVALECGFAAIELVMLWEEKAARASEFNRLRHVRAIHAPITEFDHERFTQSLTRACELAVKLDVMIVNIHPGARQFGEDNVRRCNETLQELAAKYQRTVVLEVMPSPRKPKHVLQQSHQSPQAWVEDVVQQKLLGTLDTTHVASWGISPHELVPQLRERLAHVHVSDFLPEQDKTNVSAPPKSDEVGVAGTQHLFIGDGTIKFRRFFRAIHDLNLGARTMRVTLEQAGKYDLLEYQGRIRDSLHHLRECAHVDSSSRV